MENEKRYSQWEHVQLFDNMSFIFTYYMTLYFHCKFKSPEIRWHTLQYAF